MKWSVLAFLASAALVSGSSESAALGSALNKAVDPLYAMTDSFLDVVFPGENLDVFTGVLREMFVENKNGPVQFLQDNWQSMLTKYPGFGACVVIGLLAAALLLVIGPVFCLCRLCGRCGGKAHHEEPTNAKCKHMCCSFLFFLVTTAMIGGGAMVFLSNEGLQYQIQPAEDGQGGGAFLKLHSQLSDTLGGLEQGVQEIVNVTYDGIVRVRDKTLLELDDGSSEIVDRVGNLTNVDSLLDEGALVVDNVRKLKMSLILIQDDLAVLANFTTSLKTQLQSVSDQIVAKTNSSACTNTIGCFAIQLQAMAVSGIADYAQVDMSVNQSVSDALSVVQNVSALSAFVDEGRARYDSIKSGVTDDLNKTKNDIAKTFNRAVNEIADVPIASIIQKLVSEQIRPIVNDVAGPQTQNQVFDVAKYVYYAAIALGSLIMLIGLLFYVGLAIGICSSPKSYDSGVVNRSSGSCFLVSGLVLIFLFISLLLVLTAVLFFVGGLTKGQVCPALRSPGKLAQAGLPFQVGDLTASQLFEALQALQDNKTLFNAIGYRFLNLSDYNLDRYVNRSTIGELAGGFGFDASSINLLPVDTVNELIRVAQLNIDNINFQAIYNQTDRESLTNQDLLAFAQRLNVSSIGVPTFTDQVDQLVLIQREINEDVLRIVDELKNATMSVETQLDFPAQLIALRDKAIDTQAMIQDQTDGFVHKAINDTIDQLFTTVEQGFEDVIDAATNRVAFGGNIASGLMGAVDTICEDLINPVNGIWFGLGWCIFFMLIAIFPAAYLSWLYRSDRDYEYKQDSNYDNYPTNPRNDNIPLSSMPPQHQRYAVPPGGGYPSDQGYLNNSYLDQDGVDYGGPAPPYEHAVNDQRGFYGGGVVGSVGGASNRGQVDAHGHDLARKVMSRRSAPYHAGSDF